MRAERTGPPAPAATFAPPRDTHSDSARRREDVGKRLAVAFGAALAASTLASHAGAAVICQKGSRVKFRADACKPGWTELATVGSERAGGPDPSGIWEYQSGTLLDVTRLSPRFLVLEPDGSGRLNLSPGAGGVL